MLSHPTLIQKLISHKIQNLYRRTVVISFLSTDLNSQNYALLNLSSKVEYALLALLELASYKGNLAPLTMSEITSKQAIPERYLEQILTSLRRVGLVKSHRGSRGGFVLVREPWQITLLEIVTLLEGENKHRETETPTIERDLVREVWEQANAASVEVLRRYTLQDLCQLRDDRIQHEPMYHI